jgi:hypothetical protein
MSSESVCQVACSWVDVGSASVRNILDTTSYIRGVTERTRKLPQELYPEFYIIRIRCLFTRYMASNLPAINVKTDIIRSSNTYLC